MSIERINNELLIRIPSSIDMGILQQFLDYVRVKTVSSQSVAMEEEILILSDEINKNWWTKNKQHFLK